MADQQKDFSTEIELLKRDFSGVDKYFSKIDSTLEKIGEAVSQITKMIYLHDERIQNSQHEDAALRTLVETRHTEAFKAMEIIEVRMESNYKEVMTSITNLETNLTKSFMASGQEADGRLKKLELWRYLLIGGAMVTLFFVGGAYNSIINNRVDPQTIQIVAPVKTPDQVKVDQINAENQRKVDQMNSENQKKVEANAAVNKAQAAKPVVVVVTPVVPTKTETTKSTTKTKK